MRRKLILTTSPAATLLAAIAVIAAYPKEVQAATGSTDKPVLHAFFDEFERFDGDRWFISDGWSNGDWQNCTWSKAAVAVNDGLLTLSYMPQADGTYLCGEIQTRARAHHGTIAARMRTARHSGLNAALFTYIGPTHGQPHDEIDVEILTRDPGSASLNTYVEGEAQHGTEVGIDPPADEAWHVYAMRWTSDGVVWTIDGVEVHRTSGRAVDEGTLPQHAQKIYLSHWGSDRFIDWMGAFVPPPGPVIFEVDWVAYMPLGEECLFPQALSCIDR